MSPDQITAALRDFAAASAQSPDPARSVAELALLLAHLFDQAREAIQLIWDREQLEAILRAVADKAVAPVHTVQPIGPGEFDDMAFPPVDNLPAPVDQAQLDQAAMAAAGLTPEQWAQLPDTERAHAYQVAAQLAQRPADES